MIEIRTGRRINVAVYPGDPKQPVLFMFHGMGGRGDQWREQVKYFQNKYTLVVPDLLGQGESDKPEPSKGNPYTFAELYQDTQAIFDRYAGDNNIVCGHSYGGAFASYLAWNNPSRIQKLILITPVACQPYKEVPLIYFLPVKILEFMRSSLDKSFEKLAFSAADNPELVRIEREARNKNPMGVIKSLLMGMSAIPRIDPARLQCPTLIISGCEDRLIPVASVKRFYTQLPHHQLYVLDNAAHLVHLERSAEVNKLIAGFLAT